MDNPVDALHMQKWYLYAALAQVALIQIFRKHGSTAPIWQKIPDGLRWLPGALMGFATAFLATFTQGAAVADSVLAGMGGVLGISIPAMGFAAGLKESHVKWDGGAGGKPQMRALAIPVTMLMLALGTPLLSTSCAKDAQVALAQQAQALGRSTYNAAVIALEYLDAEEAETIRLMRLRDPLPTEAEFERAKARADRIERVRETLKILRTELSSDRPPPKDELLAALSLLILAIDEARADGKPIPESIRASVVSARTLLRGAP